MDKVMRKILDVVSEITDIDAESIISKSRRGDIVMARKLFTNICLKYGYTTISIASSTGKSREAVRKLFVSSFRDEETRRLYKMYSQLISEKLTTIKT